MEHELLVTRHLRLSGKRALTLNLVNEKAAVSPDMAIRITKAFGGDAETWLRMQMNYDLAEARKREGSIKVRRYKVKGEGTFAG